MYEKLTMADVDRARSVWVRLQGKATMTGSSDELCEMAESAKRRYWEIGYRFHKREYEKFNRELTNERRLSQKAEVGLPGVANQDKPRLTLKKPAKEGRQARILKGFEGDERRMAEKLLSPDSGKGSTDKDSGGSRRGASGIGAGNVHQAESACVEKADNRGRFRYSIIEGLQG